MSANSEPGASPRPTTGPARRGTDATQPTDPRAARKQLFILAFGALGVVYGDIGTSPLYAVRECFRGEYGIEATPANVFGVLSLILWSLITIVCVKYLTVVLRADNRGEGGVLALTALASPRMRRRKAQLAPLVVVGLFAAALLYGDGAITPAISVLSAIEGLEILTTALRPYVIPVTVLILVALFGLQSRGTAGIGALFGPVMVVWFGTIGLLGLIGVMRCPEILGAVNPIHGAHFLLHNHIRGFLVLGAVFLCVTGTEALYADMGHFGLRPIRLTWFSFVLPCLALNYAAQCASLLRDPEQTFHPFYTLAPSWLMVPMVVLATTATIIASQAVISGAFSLTRQAIQLGYLPRMRVVHTSATKIGQIYVPTVNWLLMLATVGLVLGFRSSSKLAAAYGVAVTMTMLATTTLFYTVARRRWHWRRWQALPIVIVFLAVDGAFFGANITKIAHGAWFPIVTGISILAIFVTWKRGRDILGKRIAAQLVPMDAFLEQIREDPPVRVEGRAIYMAGDPQGVPPALLHNLRHNGVLHSKVGLLTIMSDEVPRVPEGKRLIVQNLGDSIYRMVAHYGFAENPDVPEILALAREQGLDFPLEETSFFLGRERMLQSQDPAMPSWQSRLFGFLSQNAQGATSFFRIPPAQVVELGSQVEI